MNDIKIYKKGLIKLGLEVSKICPVYCHGHIHVHLNRQKESFTMKETWLHSFIFRFYNNSAYTEVTSQIDTN